MHENILPCDGEAFYFPDVFDREVCERYYSGLVHEVPWRQKPIKIFGREVMQPRLTAWYGDEGRLYTYSGITMQPLAWSPVLRLIKTASEQVAGVCFNSALLNYYRDGHDSMGWHRDNEKMLGPEPVIASVSFGTARLFQFRNYQQKDLVRAVDLEAGSVLLMRGATQQHWEHRLPKKAKLSGGRINITFRIV